MTPRYRTIARTRVLSMLLAADGAEVHGFELARAMGSPTGTVYPILRRLEADGWLTSRWDTGRAGPPRRMYQLTEGGARAARDTVPPPPRQPDRAGSLP